jgi:hypothetical protein
MPLYQQDLTYHQYLLLKLMVGVITQQIEPPHYTQVILTPTVILGLFGQVR